MISLLPAGSLLAFTIAALVAACGGSDTTTSTQPDVDPVTSLASCGNRTDFFTVTPIAFTDFYGWVPLGNLSPPLHTFPSPHQYLYHTLAGGALHTVAVVAPGDIVLTRASRRAYTDGHSDYTLQFGVCREVTGYFNHMATVDPSISARLPAFDQQCFTSTAAPAYTDCTTRAFSVSVTRGASLGTAGGVPGLLAWDFGLRDSRSGAIPYANPARWDRSGLNGDLLHVVAASDYFAEPMRSQVATRLGHGEGTDHRTVAPIGGTLNVDVPGSAQGYWFNTAQLGGTEGPHLAIVPDNVDPTKFALSGSESLSGYGSTISYWFPVTSGMTNPAPRTIVADGQVRCLNLFNTRSVLLLLVDATTLRVEVRPVGVNCATLPWSFGSAAFDFHR